MQTRDESISTMDVEQRVRKLETLVTLLVEYINRYNINNAVNANHLQLLSLSRDEALHRHRINYEVRSHKNDDNDDDELAEDEIDGVAMEDWDAECKLRPEPVFTLQTTTPRPLKPKDSFLRYVKTVHGRDTARRVREQLNSKHITNANFSCWKADSSQHIDKQNNPPVDLLCHHK